MPTPLVEGLEPRLAQASGTLRTVALSLACLGVLGPAAATLLSNGSAIVATGNSLRPLWTNGTETQSNAKIARSINASATDRATAWDTVSTMRAVT